MDLFNVAESYVHHQEALVQSQKQQVLKCFDSMLFSEATMEIMLSYLHPQSVKMQRICGGVFRLEYEFAWCEHWYMQAPRILTREHPPKVWKNSQQWCTSLSVEEMIEYKFEAWYGMEWSLMQHNDDITKSWMRRYMQLNMEVDVMEEMFAKLGQFDKSEAAFLSFKSSVMDDLFQQILLEIWIPKHNMYICMVEQRANPTFT